MQAFKDIYLACLSLGAPIFGIILTELSSLMDTATDLDLRWANQAILNDCILWCMKMGVAHKSSEDMQTYWQEFVSNLEQLISYESPRFLSKASLMLAIEDLQPPTASTTSANEESKEGENVEHVDAQASADTNDAQ